MSWVSGVAIFFIIWWTSLFAILPIGMRSQQDDNDIVLGTTHSAPSNFRLLPKVLWTTLVAAIVFGLFYWVTQVWGIGPDDFPHFIPGTEPGAAIHHVSSL